MKRSAIFISILSVALVGLFALTNTMTASGESEATALQSSRSPMYAYAWPTATLVGTSTVTDGDTVLVPPTLNSLWSYNYTIDVTMAATDQASFLVILQESNKAAGGDWYELERDSIAALTTTGQIRLSGTEPNLGWVKGRKQRMVLQIYEGTGDSLIVSRNVTLKKH